MKSTVQLAHDLVRQVGNKPRHVADMTATLGLRLAQQVIEDSERPRPLWTKCEILEMLVLYGWRDTDLAFLDGDIATLKVALKEVLRDTRRYWKATRRVKRAIQSKPSWKDTYAKELEDYDANRRWNHLSFKVIRLAIKYLEGR